MIWFLSLRVIPLEALSGGLLATQHGVGGQCTTQSTELPKTFYFHLPAPLLVSILPTAIITQLQLFTPAPPILLLLDGRVLLQQM